MLNSTLSPFSQNRQAVRMQTMQHNAELTFQAQPVDLFFYRQAFERCVTTYYVKNEKQQSFPLPSLFSLVLSGLHHSTGTLYYMKHGAYRRVFSLSLSSLFHVMLCYNINENIFCQNELLTIDDRIEH